MIRPKRKLPKKWSRLLRIAVRDARKVQKTTMYQLDMSTWHTPLPTSKPVCHVCLAGAVMCQTLKAPRNKCLVPCHFGDDISSSLQAINCLRTGYLPCNAAIPESKETRVMETLQFISDHVTNRYDGQRAPWHIYLKAAERLERLGL